MKLAIIGASYLQLPLILKAKEMGIETHVFAWKDGAVGKEYADFFYPISITEKEEILEYCKGLKIDGITTIASDLAVVAVNYVADKLGLVGNSIWSTVVMTNKYQMREELSKHSLPCPKFMLVTSADNIESQLDDNQMEYPVIIKPTDRSGSRGITKLTNSAGLQGAVERAINYSLSNEVIIEEFIEGEEVSVETISYQGKHYHLAITDKVTTGEPNFVELEHHQPSKFTKNYGVEIQDIVNRALSALQFKNGASHTELLITPNGITIVEIGGRMGGDFIGSSLVELSTGFDFVKATIEVALGLFVYQQKAVGNCYSGIRYIQSGVGVVQDVLIASPLDNEIVSYDIFASAGDKINELSESADRVGYYIYQADKYYKPRVEPITVLI